MSTNEGAVVVGVDGSPESKQALVWAARYAARIGARLVAVAAWEMPAGFGWSAFPYDWDPGEDARAALASAVEEVLGVDHPTHVELIVQSGRASAVLLDESKGAAMLVVGSRGRGGFAGLLLGSVSATVAEHAECPVLVMHGKPAA